MPTFPIDDADLGQLECPDVIECGRCHPSMGGE